MAIKIVKIHPIEPNVGLWIAYGAMTERKGRDGFALVVPAGRHYWQVDHGNWVDSYLTRREAREARKAYMSS